MSFFKLSMMTNVMILLVTLVIVNTIAITSGAELDRTAGGSSFDEESSADLRADERRLADSEEDLAFKLKLLSMLGQNNEYQDGSLKHRSSSLSNADEDVSDLAARNFLKKLFKNYRYINKRMKNVALGFGK